MSFHPFAVQCFTCGSKLRVTDPSIVGTIASCPKCHSMVQIERQEDEVPTPSPLGGQVAVGQSSVDSEAITEEAINADPSSIQEPNSNESAFAGSQAVSEAQGTDAVGSPLSWQSEKTQRSRQIAFVVAVSIAGLLVAIAIFGWFVQSWQAPNVVAVSPNVETSQELDDSGKNSDATPPPTETQETDGAATQSTDNDDSTELQSETQPPTNQARSNGTPENAAAEQPTDTESATPIPADLMSQSPIGASEPSGSGSESDQSPLITSTKESESPKEDDVPSLQELPPGFAKFTEFLLEDGSLDEPNLAAPPTMEEVKIQDAAEDDVDPLTTPAKPLNLKADLGIEIALSSDGYPLSDLVMVVSQMTGVPIQLDWVSFDLAGMPINSSVATPKGWKSAREILDHVAEQFDAEIREEELLVAFTLNDEKFDTKMEEITDLSDFGDTKDSASLVLAQFLNGAEATRLTIGGSRDEKQLAALAIESLRRMRAIHPKVADEHFQHWARVSENDTLDWPLVTGGKEAPTDGTPIALAGFLNLTARHNQSTCIVNWHDFNRRNVAPQSLLLPVAGGNAATTLERSLKRFSIQVREVDQNRWWVGSEHTYDQLPVVVWTSALGQTRDAFVQRLAAIMSANPDKPFQMTYDSESDRALLLLPRYIVRQLPKITAALAAK